MRAVVQRVSRAAVRVEGQGVGEIRCGLLVLLGIGRQDTAADTAWMIPKLLNLRIFPDDAGKMNRSVTDVGGELLVVSQFTLYGDARNGTRPSFTEAMPPAAAEPVYVAFLEQLRAATRLRVAEGRFAALMDVELVNAGPVTIVLESPQVARASSGSARSGWTPETGDPPTALRSSDQPTVGHASRVSSTPSASPVGHASRVSSVSSSYLFVPFDPDQPVAIHTRNLPHWRQPGATYFVTFRLADSLPREKLDQWRQEREDWLRQHPPPQSRFELWAYHERFTDRLQRWLDAGEGQCVLRRPAVAGLVEDALRHFDGERYWLGTFVIMPNHVHALLTPLGEHELSDIVHSWKSYTAHQINRLCHEQGPVWQREGFDHLVRNEPRLLEYEWYIQQNPTFANLSVGAYRSGVGRAARGNVPGRDVLAG